MNGVEFDLEIMKRRVGRFLFVSVDLGPYLSITPLAQEFAGEGVVFLLDGSSHKAHQTAGATCWDLQGAIRTSGSLEQFLRDWSIKAVVMGTSESLPADNLEHKQKSSYERLFSETQPVHEGEEDLRRLEPHVTDWHEL